MPMKVPTQQEREILTAILTPAFTLKLYSNDKTPVAGDVASDYTEVVGGGYVNQALLFADVSITGTPPYGVYPNKQWIFTGVTGAPGTIYGYYVTRDSDGKLMWAERFPSGSLPFSPIAGSKVIVLPKYQVQSLF